MDTSKLSLENFLILDAGDAAIYSKEKYEFPFKISLSLEKLINHIEQVAETGDNLKKSFAKSILDELAAVPELRGTISDKNVILNHERLVDDMMMFVLPSAFWDKQTYAASEPFMHDIFYSSPKFRSTIKLTGGEVEGELNIDSASFNFGKTIGGFVAVLHVFYGMRLLFEFPIVYRIPDPETGLDRYFKMNLADEFLDIKLKGELKPLSRKDLESIRANIYNIEYLKKMIEPENFEFSGFVILNAINITATEILSAIKKDLIERDTITTHSGFLKLQHHLRSLLKCPDLLLGLADYPGSTNKLFRYGHKIGNSFLMSDACMKKINSIKDSIYEFSFEKKRALIVEDLSAINLNSEIEEEILKQGIKNILIAPLSYNNNIVGILELGSPEPGQINKVNALVLREVLPLFAMAVARSKEELNNKIEALIKEKCTAIHPTLEWRFRNAAMNLLMKENAGEDAEMEEIVFQDVYPLYGLSDIRNSSVQRNDVIRADLLENLDLARNIVSLALKSKKLKILNEIIYKLDKKADSLKFGISSADEAEILRFLNRKIVTLFDHLKTFNEEVKNAIEKYHSSVDPKLGFVYKRRKDFEESVAMINDMIAGYLDDEQEKIQEIFPHYFERYKTDGVDHNIYIGSSLVEHKKFNKIYLRNLRLWQLISMCGVVKKSAELKKDLIIPLETAHLILVQDSPLTIRFKFDEKQFDVDGAYNIRYEIMKKRIDKAEIKGKEERLTQPGKIAIVFSQNSEAQEYLEYIEYLQAIKFLKRDVEEVELEDLQGVKGLKALRVSVDLDNLLIGDKADVENIKKVVSQMTV